MAEVAEALDHWSGLLGLAGVADMRDVLAVEVWLHRLRGSVAAMAAALGGLDALVFSGGASGRPGCGPGPPTASASSAWSWTRTATPPPKVSATAMGTSTSAPRVRARTPSLCTRARTW
ncbi:MAG: hypothetical protein ACR2GH_22965 [Pseudonocardia sp.]